MSAPAVDGSMAVAAPLALKPSNQPVLASEAHGCRPAEAVIGANATLALVEGAGHAAHPEQPDRFLATVRPWLAAHEL